MCPSTVCILFFQEFDATMTTYGLVVDVAVTGVKKTIVIRSPIQVGENGGETWGGGSSHLTHSTSNKAPIARP